MSPPEFLYLGGDLLISYMPKKSNTVKKETSQRDDLIELLAGELNKSNKDGGKVAYFLDEQENPADISDWISTGSSMLDLAISNRPHGGLPVGKLAEFNGLEGCVTEDTKIKVIIDTGNIKEITVGEVESLLVDGKNVKVMTRNDKFVEITNFVDKGLLDTYQVVLDTGISIKVSREHKFFTNTGWVETRDLKHGDSRIYCDDDKYHTVNFVDFIGKHRIVDISVNSDEHSYYGNGMLNHNTGKSLVSAHVVANTQKKGGIAVVIDTENSAAPEFWKSLGVDLSKLLYVQCETVEDIFEKIEQMIGIVRKSNKDRILTIIVDSVAAASTTVELESDHGKDGYATGKSIIISKAMRKVTTMIGRQKVLIVFTNQLRQNINAMAFGDKYCVDPYTTKIKIRCIKTVDCEYIEEELSIDEFAGRFIGLNNFVCEDGKSKEIDIEELNVEILGMDLKTGTELYNRINKFIIKPESSDHYTDGKLIGTALHRIIEHGVDIHLKDHCDFKKVNVPIKVVDFEIENTHNYYANGRLNHNTVSGGKALAYHCSVRVRLNNTGKLKKGDLVVGNECKAVVVKNRMGPPHRHANFEIYFDSGIADYSSWIKVLKEQNLIKQGGSYYTYTKDNGDEWKFQSKDFVITLKTDEDLSEEIYLKICDAVIMKYKDPNSQIIDDVTLDDEEQTTEE